MNYLKQKKIMDILSYSEISVNTDVFWISLKKEENTLKEFNELLNSLNNRSDILVSSMGDTTISILVPEVIAKKTESKFRKEIIKSYDKVGVIFITCTKDVNKVPGIVTYISSIFADKNITIYDMVASYTDFVILVDEKEAYKAAGHLKRMFGC